MHTQNQRSDQNIQGDLLLALQELQRWFVWLVDQFLRLGGVFGSFILSYRRPASIARWLIITLIAAVLWVGMALSADTLNYRNLPPGLPAAQMRYAACTIITTISPGALNVSQSPGCYYFLLNRQFTLSPNIFELPFQLLFAAGVIKRMLVLSFGFWLAFIHATRYTQVVYNLPDSRCGEQFLLQSALINNYNVLHIADGFVSPGDRDTPLYRIGGPGYACIYLENAALFEKSDGTPHVVGPTGRSPDQVAFIDGFESLRQIIDLRNQREKFNIPGRSQDGIRVTAEDVQVVYSIYRDHKSASYEVPYPNQDPQAVENLVYLQGSEPWNLSVAIQIRGELYDFYSKHPLNEFLSMVEEPELRSIKQRESELQQVSHRLGGGEADSTAAGQPPAIPGIDFVSRPDITNGFYRSAEERSLVRGTQIDWVGVGTWRFPSQLILDRHRDAWRISHDNLVKSKPAVLAALKKQQRLAETLRLIQSVPVATFHSLNQAGTHSLDEILHNMVVAYQQTILDGHQDYLREIANIENELAKEKDLMRISQLDQKKQRLISEKERLNALLTFLSRFTGHWL